MRNILRGTAQSYVSGQSNGTAPSLAKSDGLDTRSEVSGEYEVGSFGVMPNRSIDGGYAGRTQRG